MGCEKYAENKFEFNSERMKSMTNETYDESESTLDGLVDFIKELPRAKFKVLNIEKYRTMMGVAAKLAVLLRDSEPEGAITIDINHQFNLGSVSVEADVMTIYSPRNFAELICKADNFEVYPLTNGNIRLDIAFYGVLISVY